jgi:GxxExxY protein
LDLLHCRRPRPTRKNCVLQIGTIDYSGISWRHAVCSGRAMLIDAPFNEITHHVIGAAIEVHRHLGPGLLESTYLPCLQFELTSRRLRFTTQQRIPIVYKGFEAGTYRVDLFVEDLIVVELKAVERLLSVHDAQLLTYLRLLNAPAGLLINFNVARLMDGVKRLLNPTAARQP